MTDSVPVSPLAATESKKSKGKRTRKSPSESLVETFVSLSLSDLTKFADGIVKADIETARFLQSRLATTLQGHPGGK